MSVTLTEFANICNDRLDEQPFATMNRRQDSTICMRIRTHVHVTQQLRNMSVSHKHRVYCKWSCVAHTQTHAYILPYICINTCNPRFMLQKTQTSFFILTSEFIWHLIITLVHGSRQIQILSRYIQTNKNADCTNPMGSPTPK